MSRENLKKLNSMIQNVEPPDESKQFGILDPQSHKNRKKRRGRKKTRPRSPDGNVKQRPARKTNMMGLSSDDETGDEGIGKTINDQVLYK